MRSTSRNFVVEKYNARQRQEDAIEKEWQEGHEEEEEDEEKKRGGYPRRLDQASMTIQLSVSIYCTYIYIQYMKEYPGGSQEMAAEATASSPIRIPLSGQIR